MTGRLPPELAAELAELLAQVLVADLKQFPAIPKDQDSELDGSERASSGRNNEGRKGTMPTVDARKQLGRAINPAIGDRGEVMRSGAKEETGGGSVIQPRLLDLNATAAYLGVSAWTVRDLEHAGVLQRVRIPLLKGRELRKLLFDRLDLDRLIQTWKMGSQ